MQELFNTLVDELHKQIYIKSTSSVVKEFQRTGSSRSSVRKVKDRLMYGKTEAEAIDGECKSYIQYVPPLFHLNIFPGWFFSVYTIRKFLILTFFRNVHVS